MKRFLIIFTIFICFQAASGAWRKIDSGTLAWFHAIRFVNPNKGFIAGSKGTFLVTEDGGKTWKQSKKFTEDKILDIFFTDEKNGWLLCERDVFSLGKSSPSYLLKTTDGGEKWEKSLFPEDGVRISRIFFDQKNVGYAIGERGIFYVLQDDGKSWKQNTLPVSYRMLSGAFPAEFKSLLVGGGGTILFSEDAGVSWNTAALSVKSERRFNSVFFVNAKTGWTVGAEGKIYSTFNGGKFWREQNSGVAKDLNDVFFTNTAQGFAVGDEGTILQTQTGGNVWEKSDAGTKHRLERVVFAGNKGFAVGFGGTILVYDGTEEKKPATKPELQKRN